MPSLMEKFFGSEDEASKLQELDEELNMCIEDIKKLEDDWHQKVNIVKEFIQNWNGKNWDVDKLRNHIRLIEKTVSEEKAYVKEEEKYSSKIRKRVLELTEILRENQGKISDFARLRTIYSNVFSQFNAPTDKIALELENVLKRQLDFIEVNSKQDIGVFHYHISEFLKLLIESSGKQLDTEDETSSPFEAEPTFVDLRGIFSKAVQRGKFKRESIYKPFLIGHPSRNRLSEIRLGRKGSQRQYLEGVNCTDITTKDYVPNMVSQSFLQGFKGSLGLFMINSFFPFTEVYNPQEMTKLLNRFYGQEIDWENFNIKETQLKYSYSFDDADTYLGQGILVDYDKNVAVMDNSFVLNKLSEVYGIVRKNVAH